MSSRVHARLSESVSTDFLAVEGSGMGGGGGGKSGTGKSDANNTLRSKAMAQIVETLGEGEIVGLVDGAKSIFFDATPLQNSDGSYNFKGVTWQQRTGQPEQAMLKGLAYTATTWGVGVEVKSKLAPPVRAIPDRNATQCRVIINIPTLVIQSPKDGSLYGTNLSYNIDLRPNGGQWFTAKTETFRNEKTTSPYQKASMVDLPAGGFPYSIRVVKTETDSGSELHANSMVWESYTPIVQGKFTYPNTALVAMEIDAANFGSSIPTRYYDVKGLIIQVPSHYDPETRTYSGFWDGTFKRAWSNNPAWIFYDLITNNRYGLGEFIDGTKVDKFGLLEIAQWCDGQVDDGKGGTEPRYTFNGVINTRDEAFKVLQQITTSFRGMAFWSVGQVFAVADMPADVKRIVAPANVLGGAFKYARTAKKTRNTVAMVSWNDPEDFYRPAIEVVQHDEGLDRFGWRQTDIQAVGCTSRGLAHRIGRWTLDTEHTATESVEFEMALEALAKDPLKPGDIIAVADPRKAQASIGGRVVDRDANLLTLDRPFTPLASSTYRLSVVMASGSIETQDVIGWEEGGTVARLAANLSGPIVAGAMWAITGTDVAPRQYRVLTVTEPKKNTFKVAGLFHDPTKYARVEEGIALDPIRYTRPKTKIDPVTNIRAVERQYFRDGMPRTEVLLSWSPANDWLSSSYQIFLVGPDGDVDMGVTTAMSMTLSDLSSGEWTAYVTAIGDGNARANPASEDFVVKGWEGTAGPTISNLRVRGTAGGQFSGKDCVLDWDVVWPEGSVPYAVDYVVRVFDLETRALLSDWVAPGQTFAYGFDANAADGGPRRKFWIQVRARDVLSREGAPASLVCENPAPDLIIPDLQTTTESLFVAYDKPLDLDFAGALVWMERAPGFDPLTTKPAYDGSNTLINLKATKEVFYYVRFAAYDLFSKTGLNISPEQKVYLANKIIDVDPPEIPSGLNLTSEIETALDGTVTSVVKATWGLSPSPNFAGYEVEIRRKGDEAWIRDRTSDNFWAKHGLLPGETYQVRVRAFNGSDKESGWSLVAEIVAALNTTAPGPVTAFAAENAFQTAILHWVDPTQRDLAYVEIYAASAANGTRALLGRSVAGQQSFFDKTLAVAQERFYWARTVNSSGTKSTVFVGPARAVSPAIQKEMLANAIIDQTAFADGLTAIGTFNGLPAVAGYAGPLVIINKLDGKLYQLKDGAWILVVSEVKVEDIVGKITSDMLAQIDAAKLAGQLTDAQLQGISAGKLIGLVVDAQLQAVSAGKLTGQIVRTQISDNAISSPQIQAGSVNADRLVAQSITAQQIAARAITASQIAVGTLTGDLIAANTITGTNIQGRTITGAHVVAGSITAGEIAAKTITAGNIQAGSITGAEIQAGSVNADRLVANSITAGQISVGAIKAEAIAAGAITADAIGIGLTSGNLLFNSGFEASNSGFRAYAFSDGVAATDGWRTDWAPQGMGSAMVNRSGMPANGAYADYVPMRRTNTGWDNSYPVTPGKRVEFTSYVSVHRAKAQVFLLWINAAGQGVGTPDGSAVQATRQSSGPLEGWARIGVFGFPPEGATRVIPLCRTSFTGETDPYVFWTGLYLGKALPNQSVFSAWVPQSSTVLDGGFIATNSLSADKIVAGSITADRIAGGTITGDKIAANTITGANILANSIYADRIQIGGGASLTSWLGGPNNTQLNGGYIATNTIDANRIKIGARGIQTVGIDFSADKNTRTLSWTAGYILWVDDNGTPTSSAVSAGAVATPGGLNYIWWDRNVPNQLNVGSNNWPAILAASGSCVLLCSYDGYAGLNPVYGGTIIDGSRINTGTITAIQIAAGQIQTGHLAAGSITADKIAAGNVTADKIGAGTINAGTIYLGSDRFRLESANRMLRIFGPQGYEHVSIGNIGRFTGEGDDGAHGIIIRAAGNAEVMRVDQNGAFIEAAYIRNLKVTNAQIENGSISNAKIGNLEVDFIKIANGSLSQTVTSSGTGQETQLTIYSRSNGSKFEIRAFRRGAGDSIYSAFVNTGRLAIQYSLDGQSWGELDSVPNVTSYKYSEPVKSSYQVLHPTVLPFSWAPGYTGTVWFKVVDSNNAGVGGVHISVTELAR